MGSRFALVVAVATAVATASHPASSSPQPRSPAAPHAGSQPQPAPRPTSRRLAAGELLEIVRTAIASSGARLPKGATVGAARTTAALDVPIAPSRVTIDVTAPARRVGVVVTTATLSFWNETDITARLPVSLELSVPAGALVYDVPKGGALTLVIRRGLVEVSTPAVTAGDADVGDVVQVLLRPSGRALRAQLVAKDRALAVEDGR
jgi:hypothetical protein